MISQIGNIVEEQKPPLHEQVQSEMHRRQAQSDRELQGATTPLDETFNSRADSFSQRTDTMIAGRSNSNFGGKPADAGFNPALLIAFGLGIGGIGFGLRAGFQAVRGVQAGVRASMASSGSTTGSAKAAAAGTGGAAAAGTAAGAESAAGAAGTAAGAAGTASSESASQAAGEAAEQAQQMFYDAQAWWKQRMEQYQPISGFQKEMNRDEARKILNLDGRNSLDRDVVKKAHQQLLMRNHPDRGGSTHVATKINEAKDVLMGKGKV